MVSRDDRLIARIVTVEASLFHPTLQLGKIITPCRDEDDQFRSIGVGEIGWFHGAKMRQLKDGRKA